MDVGLLILIVLVSAFAVFAAVIAQSFEIALGFGVGALLAGLLAKGLK